MKILVLNGSPKKQSDTFRLTEAFLSGLNENGDHEVNVIRVIDKKIAPCRGCFLCWQNGDGRCVQNDDQNGILDIYREADIVIYSFPLYCYGMPSHLKALLDRTIPLVKMKMVWGEDGTVRHETLVDFSKKRTVVICGCGFPAFEGNFDGLRLACKAAFGDPAMVCVPEAPMLNVPGADPLTGPLLARFREAGREFASSRKLSPETVSALETPMIPAEEYVRIVNGR